MCLNITFTHTLTLQAVPSSVGVHYQVQAVCLHVLGTQLKHVTYLIPANALNLRNRFDLIITRHSIDVTCTRNFTKYECLPF